MGHYNQTLQAEIIGVTNGAEMRFFKIDFETGRIIRIDFKELKELKELRSYFF